MFVGGEYRREGAAFDVVDPATGAPIHVSPSVRSSSSVA